VILRFIWTDRHSLGAGTVALSRIEKLGYRVGPGSRLPNALSRIERNSNARIIRVFHSDDFAYRLAEAHRTILEFYLITSALEELPAISDERLTLALSGHDLPEDDVRSTAARDAQFELLVTALIHHAGIRDVFQGEPDIRIKAGDKWLGIAAKRVTSRHQLRKRLRHAAKQIQAQRAMGVEMGVIALNLDRVVSERSFRSDLQRARNEFDNIGLASERFVRSRAGSEQVVGLQVFATVMGWQQAGQTAALSVEVMTHAHWSSPESEVASLGAFLRGRGTHLQYELRRLLGLVLQS